MVCTLILRFHSRLSLEGLAIPDDKNLSIDIELGPKFFDKTDSAAERPYYIGPSRRLHQQGMNPVEAEWTNPDYINLIVGMLATLYDATPEDIRDSLPDLFEEASDLGSESAPSITLWW